MSVRPLPLRAHRHTRRHLHALALAIPSLLLVQPASATVRTWLDTDGLFWNNTAAWSGSVVPLAGDTVNIGTLAGSTNPTLLYNGNYAAASPLLLLDLNPTNVTTLTFAQSLGNMSATTEIIGDSVNRTTTYSQNGNNNNATTIILGNQTNGAGTYSLSGTGNVTTSVLEVGLNGFGTFAQAGGNVSISNNLAIGSSNALSNATYTLSSGTLTLNGAFMALGGGVHAAFTQTGGTLNLNGSPFYMASSTASGTNVVFSLSSTGNITNAGYEDIGSGGVGTALFTQSGGNHTFLSGSILDIGDGGAATYALSNGSLNSANVWLGDTTLGNFTQTGGTHSVSGNLSLGVAATGSGIYTLGLGTLAANQETIGEAGNGTFTQSNGTHTVATNLYVGNSTASLGNYNMNGGNLTIGNASTSGALYLGNAGYGYVTQNGGNITIAGANGYLGLSNYINSGGGGGGYTINAGSLTSPSIELGSNHPADFHQNGGTVTAVTELEIASSFGETSNYYLSNITGPSTLTVGTEYLSFSGHAFFSQDGGTHIVNGVLRLGDGVGGSGNYTLTDGTLVAHALVIGSYGTGNFTQNGGNVTLGSGGTTINQLASAGPGGSYTLQGGSLSSGNNLFYIYAGGSFTQNENYNISTQSGYINNYGSFNYVDGNFNGTLENDATGTVTIAPNTFFIAGAGILNEGSITITANISMGSGVGGSFDNENNLTLAGGSIVGAGPIINNGLLFGFGTIGGGGGFTNNGYLSAINGNILFTTSGINLNAGTIALSPGHQFTLAADLTNSGTLSLASGLLNGTNTLTNTASGSIVGPGTVTAPFTNAGLVSPGAGTLLIPTPWTNNGFIQPTGVGSQLTGGLVTNNGSIQGAGTIAAPVTNNGTIEATGGNLVFTAPLTSTGTLRASPGNKILVQGAYFPTNAGLIDLAGGTFDNGNQPLTNTGTITGFGVFSTGGGGLTNNGNITFTGGTATINGNVTNTANHTLNIKYQPALFTGNVTNNANATIKTTNTTVTFTATFINNGSYPSDPATNIFSTLTNNGSMTGGPGDVFTVSSGGSFTNTGTFSNGGTLNANANITNSGTFSQTGPAAFSSASGFTNAAGTATFSTNAKMAFLAITGGTVDTTSSMLVIEPDNKAAALSSLQSALATGSLISSTLSPNLALALIDNAASHFTTFGGLPADSNSLLLAPELLGDANVDGHVDLNDLNTVLNNLGTAAASWTSGNFDHAATIDLNDLNDVLNHLGLTYAHSSSAAASLAPSPTPEPTTAALLVAAIPLFLRRKNI